MKTDDFLLNYAGYIGRPDGICRVRFFRHDGKQVVVISELHDFNRGGSVTNNIEWIVAILLERRLVNNETFFIEHYEPHIYGHTFDRVTFTRWADPVWDRLELNGACALCGVEKDELLSLTEDNKVLMKQLVLLTQKNYENLLSPKYSEFIPHHILFRKDIRKAIDDRASERELQRLLKTDLSLLAEVYAYPKEEYICFSEFPVGDKPADFAVFTGTSRMDVILIEIKGADFGFSNRSGYKKLNEKINTCRHQLIEKLNYVRQYRYEEFRRFCHQVREEVEETGNTRFNSFRGPDGCNNVDRNKAINVIGVIIGGRSRDDYYESELRHREESMSPVIRIESWDSWFRKLRRP